MAEASTYRWVSHSQGVREDQRFVTGNGRYVADLVQPGTLHVGLVTSPHAHARITAIDTQEALRVPGVVAVLTGEQLAKETEPLRQYLDLPDVHWRPLAVDETRYAGEWVAAVVAESRAQAEDGAELVVVDYEPLTSVLAPEAAMADDAPLVHPGNGTNIMTHREFTWGDVDEDFASCDGTAEVRVRWGRNSTVPLETFGVVASWDRDRAMLDVWASIQMPQFPDQLAAALRLAGNQVRVHFDVDVGGSYGVKRGIKHGVLASYLTRMVDRPVALIEDRAENMHGGDFHGPDRIFDVSMAYTNDGTITSMRLRTVDDEGAYPGRSPLQLAKPIGAIVGPYRIGSVEYTATGVATNKTGQVAVRGFGQAPTNYAIESCVDEVADALELDRMEVRRRNLIGPDEFPYRIPSGTEYDSGDYPAVVDKAETLADLPRLRERRDALRAAGTPAGIGYATCLEPSGGNAIFENIMNPRNDKTTFPEACRLRVDGSGAVTAIISISSAGQSHDTMVATFVGEELECDPAAVTVLRADSLAGMPSQSPVGSRMAIVLGRAIKSAAEELKTRLRAIAAHQLGAAPDDVVYRGGDVALATAPERHVGWDELVAIAHRKYHLLPAGLEPGLETVNVAQVPHGGTLTQPDGTVQVYPCFSFESHVVLVVLDPVTAKPTIESYNIAHDCGTVINPEVVRGMVYGGVAHGIGVALYEEFAFSPEGQPLTQSFMDYLLPSAHEVPDIVDAEHETPSPHTTHGQKGAGEAGYMGAPAAVASAVNDALDGAGGRAVRSLPIKPSDAWAAMRSGAPTSQEGTP